MNSFLRKTIHVVGLAILVSFPTVDADDTDIYLNPSVPTGSEPLVMFSLDTRSNLGSTVCSNVTSCDEADFYLAQTETAAYVPASGSFTFFDHLRLALRLVFADLDGVQVGLMVNHDHSTGCAGPQPSSNKCSNGGYIALGFDSFDLADTNGHKAAFHDILNSMPTPSGGVSHSYQGAELFFEFFRYLTGQGVYNGYNGYNDYGTNQAQNLDADGAAYDWDASIIDSNDDYISPLAAAGSCAEVFTVNMLFQVANQESDSNAAIEDTQANGGMSGIGSVPSSAPFETVIDYMNDVDLADGNFGTAPDIDGTQSVTSYFVVDPRFINNTTTAYAESGGTVRPLELGEDPQELIDTLTEIFNQILSVSTTFVASSVPVNVFNRAEIVDNVYIAIFQADETGLPLWPGNLKKLKFNAGTLADGSSDLTLVDANGDDAIASDGRIRFGALTFWTDAGDLPAADPNTEEVDGADGRVVNRGAAGQQIQGYLTDAPTFTNADGGRQIFYNGGGTLVDFDADATAATALQSVLGAADASEAREIIAFTRGIDVDTWDNGDSGDARPWMMGDALHSRPVPINYGAWGGHSEANPAIFIAMGTNDGHMHFIRNTTSGGDESGEEVWSFVPYEIMGELKTFRENLAVSPPHPYTVDGPATVWQDDANGNGTIDAGEDVWLFFGLRRGGSAYYGLDISDPENPALMWSITPSSSGFGDMGATFSQPRVAMMEAPGGAKPLLVFGGGYDFDNDGSSQADDSVGNAIYVVDAETGAQIWRAEQGSGGGTTVDRHAEMDDSIPSDVALFDSDGDGFSDRAYVGDTGGRVWRVDMKGSVTSDWEIHLIADVGRHTSGGSPSSTDRRFFHRPDVVQTRDSIGSYDAVVIGAGNRPDPLDKDFNPENWVYMIKDRFTTAGGGADTGYEHADFGDVTSNCLQNDTCGGAAPDLTYGWRLELEASGEKSLASPLTIGGIVFFTSFLPPGSVGASSCAPAEGNGNLYAVNLQDATAVFNYNAADDDPGQGDEPNSAADRYTQLASEGIPAEVVPLPSEGSVLTPQLSVVEVPTNTRWRTYWYQLEDDG
jgi:type IV pilus assembly protein PilY1